MLPFLKSSEAYWRAMKQGHSQTTPVSSPKVIHVKSTDEAETPSPSPSPYPLFDCIVAGGTLGIFIAAFLQILGHKCCVIDKRRVEGRRQEWNISRGELERGLLFDPGRGPLLTKEELEKAIVSSFNPVRVGFKGSGRDILINDCLNLGVCPSTLIEMVKQKFIQAGGVVIEACEFKSATLSPSDRVVEVSALKLDPSPHATGGQGQGGLKGPPMRLQLACRLLVDGMGHYSPIVQEMRRGTPPDGIVMVVGSCARGYSPASNVTADLLYSMDDTSKEGIQWFWEAFPARDRFKGDKLEDGKDENQGSTARTTYMFGYIDAHPTRPSFEQVLDQYFTNLPRYQGLTSLDGIEFKRVLFGAFPCYAEAPLKPRYDRILQMGDASASQSTLSFGGFGSLMRHLSRFVSSLSQALAEDKLDVEHLSMMHPYMPSLSSAWLFQRSMSLAVGQMQDPHDPQDLKSSPSSVKAKKDANESSTNASPSSSYPSWAKIPPDHINAVLATNFSVMQFLGDSVLRPFLQDTIQFIPLCLTVSTAQFCWTRAV